MIFSFIKCSEIFECSVNNLIWKMNVEGNVALVTGAASGIGFEIAKELLKNGVQGILIMDVNVTTGQKALEKLSEEFGSKRIHFMKTDVTNDKEFEDALKKAIELFGKLDILVNNAGILNEKNYNLEIDTNFKGVVNGVMLGLKYMSKDQLGKGGVILNVSSVTAMELQQCFPIYAATKAGTLNLTRGFGHTFHFDRTGVKVIALCPGKTETPIMLQTKNMMEGCLEEMMALLAGQDDQMPDAVGRAAIYAIKNGKSASIWMIDQNNLYKLNIPEWKSICETVVNQI